MMKRDDKTTLAELKERVAGFVKERGWEKYHNPKNLSMSISIEAAELMEHFQWASAEEARSFANDAKKAKEIRDEIADVTCYLLSFCNLYGIDLSTAVSEKMESNAVKYPIGSVKDGVLPL